MMTSNTDKHTENEDGSLHTKKHSPYKKNAENLYTNEHNPALISQELAKIDERLIDIAVERIFFRKRAITLEQIGERFGITRERVRQLEQKAKTQFDLFHNKEFTPVTKRAKALQKRLGSAILADDQFLEDELDNAVEGLTKTPRDRNIGKELLLWLAGPYRQFDQWLLTDKKLIPDSTKLLLKCQNRRNIITWDDVNRVLSSLGIKKRTHPAWLEHLKGFLQIKDGFIYLHGNVLEKAKVLIRYYDRPMPVEDMLEVMGNYSIRSVRQRLINSPDFWRINKQNEFVLAETEGYDEYFGIKEQIIQELESFGGQAPYLHLVDKLSRLFGVKRNSIVLYLNSPMFLIDENHMVRVREENEIMHVQYNIQEIATCYRTQEGAWCLRLKVDINLIRGSGRIIPNAFAQILGCSIGDKIIKQTELGPITLSWPLASTIGAGIGSLRRIIDNIGAKSGDYLFIKATGPELKIEKIDGKVIRNQPSNLIRLALMLGRNCDNEADAINHVASALGISSKSNSSLLSKSKELLISRGESALADLIHLF